MAIIDSQPSNNILQPNLINGFTIEPLTTAPTVPAVGYVNIYFKSDHQLYYQTNSGTETAIGGGGGGGVPTSRTINTTDGIQGGGDLSADRTFSLTDTGVTAGSYTLCSITVDAKGRITSASSGSVTGIPSGGATSQVLAKNSATDYDVSWVTLEGIPAGGTTNQVLKKNSATDYDVSWAESPQVYLLGGRKYFVDPSNSDADDINGYTPFITIQAAINIANTKPPTHSDPVTIEIAAGLYSEDITMKPNIYLVGDSMDNTIIDGEISFTHNTANNYNYIENISIIRSLSGYCMFLNDLASSYSFYLNVRNCNIESASGSAYSTCLFAYSTGGSSIAEINFENVNIYSKSNSLMLYNYGCYLNINNSNFNGSWANNNTNAIQLDESKSVSILNTYISGRIFGYLLNTTYPVNMENVVIATPSSKIISTIYFTTTTTLYMTDVTIDCGSDDSSVYAIRGISTGYVNAYFSNVHFSGQNVRTLYLSAQSNAPKVNSICLDYIGLTKDKGSTLTSLTRINQNTSISGGPYDYYLPYGYPASTSPITINSSGQMEFGNAGTLIPSGGGSGYVLTKNSATDYDVSWLPAGAAGNQMVLLASSLSIDALTTGTTNITTVPAGQKYIINDCIIEVSNFSVDISGDLSCRINGLGTGDVFSERDLTGIDDYFNSWRLGSDTGGFNILSDGDNIDLEITTALSGTTAEINVYLIGMVI